MKTEILKYALNYFRNKSLLYKIFLTYAVSLLLIGIFGYSYYIFNNIRTIEREIDIYQKNLINDKKTYVQNIVNTALKGIEQFYENYKDGSIDEETAKSVSAKFINSIRYFNKFNSNNSVGYIWINTIDGVMVVDPPKPELNNVNVIDFKDKNGVYLFKEMINIVPIAGEGYVSYCWPKLESNSKDCFEKISYVKYFPQWKWIVGSGFYLDEVDQEIVKYHSRVRDDILTTMFKSLMFGIVATTLAGMIFFFIVYYITSHLKRISQLSIKLLEGEINPKLKLPYSSNDEIGQLISNFNIFIDQSYKLLTFKKTIENDIDIDSVYARIISLITDEFQIDKFNFYEVNNSKNSIKLIDSRGDFYCNQDIFVDANLCRAARVANIIDSSDVKNICTSFSCNQENSCSIYICIPIIIGSNVRNVLQIIYDKSSYDTQNIQRLSKFLSESAPVIESKRLLAQLKESTLRDPLTNLYNRRFLDESADILSSTILRRGSYAGVLMCDIDFFKKVNDIYGHNIGDKVLMDVAHILKKSVRSSDMVVRFGGEEFLILMQDIEPDKVMVIAEKIRVNVESFEINLTGHTLKKTISVGVSIFPSDSKSFWQCIKFSDVALYKAKETGRNRVVRFEESMWQEEEF